MLYSNRIFWFTITMELIIFVIWTAIMFLDGHSFSVCWCATAYSPDKVHCREFMLAKGKGLPLDKTLKVLFQKKKKRTN